MCKINKTKKKSLQKKTHTHTSKCACGQHILKSDRIMMTELPAIQSASAVSSSAKPPTTSTTKESADQTDDDAQKPTSSPPETSPSLDLIPVESIPSFDNDLNDATDDELAEINRTEQEAFKIPPPKRTYKSRRTKKKKEAGSSRRLRSRTGGPVSMFSDDEMEELYASALIEY